MRIYLIGFMGCGKSSFGKRLAKKLDYPFVDLDEEIEQRAGKSIDEIFKMEGEATFRKMEQDALLDTIIHKKAVIATGGGTPCFEDNMEFMNSEGVTVYLRMSTLSITHRLENAKKTRPLVHGRKGEELHAFIKKTLADREAYYLQSHCIIKGETVKPDQVIALVFG